MTQRGPKLRREVATVPPLAPPRRLRAAATLARLPRILLLPGVLLLSVLILTPAAAAAAPAITRTRTIKPRHEAAQPFAASAGASTARSAARDRHPAGKARSSARTMAANSREQAPAPAASRRKGRLQPAAQPVGKTLRVASASRTADRGRLRHSQVPVQYAASLSNRETRRRAARLHPDQPTRWREVAEHRTTASNSAPKAQSAGVPRAAVAGGELSMDDFLRVASAAAEGVPMATAASVHTAPAVQRVDGFGAEGAVLSQPAASISGTPPAAVTLPEAAVAGAAACDPRVRALVHPSQQEMAAELSAPVVLPGLYRYGRLVVPAPMKGSHDILVHQNTMADDEGLERIRDQDHLQRLRAAGQLVDFTDSASLRINPELGPDRRCARVWTVKFAQDTARAFYARFHEPLQVNSAVRTVAYQLRLQRTNGNAAGISGDTSSPHLTGQAIDLGKRGMSVEQIAWMRTYLGPMMAAGKVDVEEEFQQACFHISVYKSYLPQVPAPRRMQVAGIARPTANDQ